MPSKIAILGFGPAAAFAARAASDMGCQVVIHCTLYGSYPPGAFWFHELPPSMFDEGSFKLHDIAIRGIGTPKEYSRRQWGNPEIPNSFPRSKEQTHDTGYSPKEVWDHIVPQDVEVLLSAYNFSDADVRDLASGYDLVLQSFPSKTHLSQQPVYLPYFMLHGDDEFGGSKGNVVIYNGKDDDSIVVREAILFGKHYMEFPKGREWEDIKRRMDVRNMDAVVLRDMQPSTIPVRQPVETKIRYIGRWACWDRTKLAHESYEDTLEFIKELER